MDAVHPFAKLLDADQVKEALDERAEDLFRGFWGEPERPGARKWRVKGSTSRTMDMSGPKRGLWYNHKTGEGGTLLDFVAVEMCGLATARDDFQGVLSAAARYCGIATCGPANLDASRARRDAQNAAQAEEAAAASERRKMLVEALQARCEPIGGSPAAAYLQSRGITQFPVGWFYLPPVPDLPVKHANYAALIVFGEDDAGQVRGGQRILITATGGKANVDVRKIAFGQNSGCPSRINKAEDGPVVICEGPETAASIAQATGFEVWSVFGVSGFGAVALPEGRKVILCPDQDAPDSPAGKAFAKAAQNIASTGVVVAIARAPEPQGSKRDLNDTLMDQGAEVVRVAILAANLIEPPQTAQSAVPVTLTKIAPDHARSILRAKVEAGLRRNGVTLVEATLGLGKTATTIKALPEILQTDPKGAVVIAVPMHRLGRQLVEDIRAAIPGCNVVQIYGAEAQDPYEPGKTVCKQLDQYKEQAALLLDVDEVCRDCAFQPSCLHVTSQAQSADVYVVSHERLKAKGLPLKQGQTLLATVVDENPINALVSISNRGVPVSALVEAPTRIVSKEGVQGFEEADAEATLKRCRAKIKATVRANGHGYLRKSALNNWTPEEVAEARGLEWRRKINDRLHPEVSGNKSLPTVNRLLAEIAVTLADDDSLLTNARVEIRKGGQGLEIWMNTLRPINERWREAPIVMLDATANAEITAIIAGQELAHHAKISAKENVEVLQTTDLTGAKSHFFGRGKPTGNVARMSHWIRLQAMNQERTAVISNKSIIEALDLPDSMAKAHFNALRGLNDMQNVDHLIVIGRTQPADIQIGRYVAALWGTPVQGALQPNGCVERVELGPDGHGRIMSRSGTTHSCPRGQAVLGMIRDNEVIQAIGRLRGVNRETPVTVTLVSDAVVPYPTTPVQLKPDIWSAGILGPMLDRGVAFLSPSQAAKAYPDLFASRQAADKVLARLSDRATFPIEVLYGKSCAVVGIKTTRSQNTTKALVAPWVEDAQAEIEKHLLNAKVVSVHMPQEPAETRLGRITLTAAATRAAALADPDGVARTSEAIEAFWDWVELLAQQNASPTLECKTDYEHRNLYYPTGPKAV